MIGEPQKDVTYFIHYKDPTSKELDYSGDAIYTGESFLDFKTREKIYVFRIIDTKNGFSELAWFSKQEIITNYEDTKAQNYG